MAIVIQFRVPNPEELLRDVADRRPMWIAANALLIVQQVLLVVAAPALARLVRPAVAADAVRGLAAIAAGAFIASGTFHARARRPSGVGGDERPARSRPRAQRQGAARPRGHDVVHRSRGADGDDGGVRRRLVASRRPGGAPPGPVGGAWRSSSAASSTAGSSLTSSASSPPRAPCSRPSGSSRSPPRRRDNRPLPSSRRRPPDHSPWAHDARRCPSGDQVSPTRFPSGARRRQVPVSMVVAATWLQRR